MDNLRDDTKVLTSKYDSLRRRRVKAEAEGRETEVPTLNSNTNLRQKSVRPRFHVPSSIIRILSSVFRICPDSSTIRTSTQYL